MKQPVSRIVKQSGIQPRGGYLPPKSWEVEDMDGNSELAEAVQEVGEYCSISPQTVGMVVDYLFRSDYGLIHSDDPVKAMADAFRISIMGANMVGLVDKAYKYFRNIALELIKGQDRNNKVIIENACRLVQFDSVVRAMYIPDDKPVHLDEVDVEYIACLEMMLVNRFSHLEKPIVEMGFIVSGDGAKNISSSDGDYLTEDSLIDLKVSKKEPDAKNTLQLLLYYLMGLHENPEVFGKLKYLKILNPRLNKVYTYDLSNLPQSAVDEVNQKIIGY